MPTCEDEFFTWLAALDCRDIKVYALPEGTICFPRVPLLRIEGPLAVGQLLETPLLNLVNYPSLVATNGARHRLAAGADKTLLEFGLRRAQGPDGALSASRYSYIGGFDGTANLLAGKLTGIKVSGTHAHAFVQSYSSFAQIKDARLDGCADFAAAVQAYRIKLGYSTTHTGELAAFTAYALAFPDGFLALVDTYDTLYSGVPNFICVALALDDLGHHCKGVRLDSGDLSFLSKEVRKMVGGVAKKMERPWLRDINIVASNDINEQVSHVTGGQWRESGVSRTTSFFFMFRLGRQGHEINTFGIGTNLVTCQEQPALGCVYKLVEIGGQACIKISQAKSKISLPGRKAGYRLYGHDGKPILDLMVKADEPAPEPHKPILCRHPFEATKRALVTPLAVKPLHALYWDGPAGGLVAPLPPIDDLRRRVAAGIAEIREDTLRVLNPTPYKVSLSEGLYEFLHELWEKEAPIKELS
ncbi:unnamed protein product [Phaeothamnion confervicola]